MSLLNIREKQILDFYIYFKYTQAQVLVLNKNYQLTLTTLYFNNFLFYFFLRNKNKSSFSNRRIVWLDLCHSYWAKTQYFSLIFL